MEAIVNMMMPVEWRESLNTFASTADEPFNLQDEIKLSFNNKDVLIKTVISKTVYKKLRNRIIIPPTAQLNFNTHFVSDALEWKEIYSLSFRTSLDTKSHEFQYKLLKLVSCHKFIFKQNWYYSISGVFPLW